MFFGISHAKPLNWQRIQISVIASNTKKHGKCSRPRNTHREREKNNRKKFDFLDHDFSMETARMLFFWHIQKWFCRKTCLLTSTDSTICVKYHGCIHIIGFQYSYYEFHGAMLDFEMLKIAMWQFVTSNTVYGRVSAYISICNRQWMFQADNRFLWIFWIRV